MGLLEAQVHHCLKSWQQAQGEPLWPHALTMGRLVSRALRLRRSALIQTGCLPAAYGVSYLLPCLLSGQPIRLVTTAHRRDCLVQDILPRLESWLLTEYGDRHRPLSWPDIVTPDQWLTSLSEHPDTPPAILTAIEQAEYLEDWTRQRFSHSLDGESLQRLCTGNGWDNDSQEAIYEHWQRLRYSLLARPSNPYQCYLLDEDDSQRLWAILERSMASLAQPSTPSDPLWQQAQQFWQFWQSQGDNCLLWAEVNRAQSQIHLSLSPIDVKPWLGPLWQDDQAGADPKAFILMGSFLDADKMATTFRQTLGLPEVLCLKFVPQRAQDALPIYLPDRLPLPNTPAFQAHLLAAIADLLDQFLTLDRPPFVVILLDDVPLKTQLGSELAARFGSRVKVEPEQGMTSQILVAGWQFWCDRQEQFPAPQVLILGTLPIPSLEHPLVASRVQYHKRHHQDWFRCYLLPSALKALQQAVLPLRAAGGLLVILDDRVNSRSYGREVLNALAPYAKSDYFNLDDWR